MLCILLSLLMSTLPTHIPEHFRELPSSRADRPRGPHQRSRAVLFTLVNVFLVLSSPLHAVSSGTCVAIINGPSNEFTRGCDHPCVCGVCRGACHPLLHEGHMCPACPCLGMVFEAYGPHIPFWLFVSTVCHSVPEFGVLVGLPLDTPSTMGLWP